MKRPQFSLRLMLLVVTLLAMAFAWRRSTIDLKRNSDAISRINLETRLAALERQRRQDISSKYQWLGLGKSLVSNDVNAQIAAVRKELDSLGH